MYFLIKVFDKNRNIIIESDKVYTYDVHKFMEFTKFTKTEFTIEIKNILEEHEKNNISISENEDIIEEVTECNIDIIFSNMYIQKYGRGYTLSCQTEHPDYGKKYYHNAWWFPSLNKWFFKKEHLYYYLDRGAQLLE